MTAPTPTKTGIFGEAYYGGRPSVAAVDTEKAKTDVKQLLLGGFVINLQPNMTGKLQPMDIVVNGPMKKHLRSARCMQLFAAFQAWVKLINEAELARILSNLGGGNLADTAPDARRIRVRQTN